MGNSQAKRRQIKLSSINGRISKQDRQNLKDAFDRIQDRQVINDYQFRLEVLGPQVHESVALKIMQLFTSEDQIPEVLNFDDLLACYIVFKYGRPEEMGQICFELMKINSPSDILAREHIVSFVEKLVDINEQQIQTFYAKTEFDPRLPIKREEFVSAFKKVQNLPLFTWVKQMIDGYSKENMNMDDSIAKASDFSKKLTVLSNERSRTETENLGFDTTEFDSMQEFFNKELKKSDAKEVLKTIQQMFKDIRVGKLKRKGMRDFSDIFKLGQNFFAPRGTTMTQQDFIDDILPLNLDFSIYEKSKYILTAMMGLHPQDIETERESILSALNNNHSLEGYIQDHLEEEDTFYIVDKLFYEAWTMNVGFVDDKSYIIKKEKIDVIDNLSLLEPLHENRLKDISYGDGFILVPRYVFYPLSKWYKCTKVIERKVISYKSDKKKSLNLFKQRKSVTGTMIIAGSSQQVPDPFFKTLGDITFELEVYPKFMYYEKINDKGERPHQKAVVNHKIDPNYLKKVLKQDKLPFQELLISRKKTFEEVLREISVTYKENFKRGRLWIEDQVISGAKLETTLEEFGITMGQLIYVEYSNNNNQWPTDKLNAGPASGSMAATMNKSGTPNEMLLNRQNENLKTVGLYNLGNSNILLFTFLACYMNSALQCLANTKFFYEYFIQERKYLKQMNLKSKHGHQGELASNFALLLQKMYQQNGRVVIPREFKQALASISEQFAGYDQQDSQEFLFFLLDGLHEELNLRQEKPYVENPDSDDRKIVELGLEQWSNTLRRDWSFIFFLFYGQLKSTLNCQKCNKISTTFDIFTNIPLSLPEPSKILLNVVIYRLPNEIKDMLQGSRSSEIFKRMDSNKSEDFNRNTTILERNPSKISKIQESLKYITNDQPIHIAIRVERDAKIATIIQQICDIKEVNIDPSQRTSSLVLFSQTKGILRGIFNPEQKLLNYNLLNNEIEAIEVLNSRGRDVIRQFYRSNDSMLDMMKTPHLSCLLNTTEKSFETSTTQSSSTNKKNKGARSQKEQPKEQVKKYDKCTFFNNYFHIQDKYQEYVDRGMVPEEIYVACYNRRFVKKAYYFFNPYQPQLIASPFIFILPAKPTGRRIYEEIWAVAQNILKKSSIYHHKKNLWWEQKNWEEKLNFKPDEIQQYKPFVLKTVERSEDFPRLCHLAIEWHSSIIEEDYNPAANEVIHHSSTQDKEIIDEDFVNLEDCLRKFHEVEEISEKDNIYCSSCKEPQAHLKKLEIFRPPPILIVQLKRFKYSNTSRNKLNTLVEFPLYNLDVSTFVTDQEFLKSQDIEQKYDLYAMINHYGNLSFGHYISLTKNFNDGKWYKYDDSARSQIPEEQIQKDFAYILFYIRKDLQNKNLQQILPSIKELFPGKPIKTEHGQGFIIQEEETSKFKIQFEKGKDTMIVTKDLIMDEKDDNELVFDAKELEQINIQKKEKLIERQKQKKKRSCLFCQSFQLAYGQIENNKRQAGKNPKKRNLKWNMINNRGANQCFIF
ncbi:ubiquitin carboxyl-terminal hydrolase 15 [Stylonychia lemnae]|uniref:Ubiquitin carboxyl-terminal hydrolase 15 n=1 Tax=Stylonychia lemnae TaxID=5949 RepID=A0A078A5Z7_STYLE|nr:ubiquitin carboxyl-terminal hydrolase 15 [Stylonychia lemnae]|eukprot:CDW76980.1 ubiquitin carboxyl-terminal hydrolase 15 [Stylonychia lemnae]